jgi:hypothetical protein
VSADTIARCVLAGEADGSLFSFGCCMLASDTGQTSMTMYEEWRTTYHDGSKDEQAEQCAEALE